MTNAVLISIHPQWCGKIADGRKIIEVRKTRPRIETPFKCYIYMTSGGREWRDPWCTAVVPPNGKMYNGARKVIGEFICDCIEEFEFTPYNDGDYVGVDNITDKSCLYFEDLYRYIGKGHGYGWHISEVKIYDVPKELSEFETRKDYGAWITWRKVERAPQSWCYVYEEKRK